jgi:hypothetical protein
MASINKYELIGFAFGIAKPKVHHDLNFKIPFEIT